MLKFGDVTIAPGEKKRFMLPFTKVPSGQDLGIPMMVVNGRDDGPVFLADGGIHGDEYESGEAIRGLWRDMDPSALRGAFVGVPVVNVPAFEAGQRTTPVDGLNLNRVFPGREDGSLTERLAHCYIEEVVRKCDMGIDLHGGGTVLAISPLVIYRQTGDAAMEEKMRDMSFATGIDLVWKGGGAWGGSLNVAGPQVGVPIITAELGGEGRCLERCVRAQRKLVENLLMHHGMISGTPEARPNCNVIKGTFQTSATGGLYRTTRELRDEVRAGDLLGTIADLFGDVMEEVRAPEDGVIVSQRTFPTINCGDWTVLVGTPGDS